MNPYQKDQSRNVSQGQTNGRRLHPLANGSMQEFSMRLSGQQWLSSYVQTVQNTLQMCQQLRELGVDSSITDRLTGIVENTLRRDIPGLEPTTDEYLVEDISNAEGLQNAVTVLRSFGFDVDGEFDFDQFDFDRKAADDMSRQAKKQSA